MSSAEKAVLTSVAPQPPPSVHEVQPQPAPAPDSRPWWQKLVVPALVLFLAATVVIAPQVAKLLEESERLAGNQQQQGLILVSDARQASATNYKAKADLSQANLAYLLAWAELQRTMGCTPGAQG